MESEHQLQTKQNRNHAVMTSKKRDGKISKYLNIYSPPKKNTRIPKWLINMLREYSNSLVIKEIKFIITVKY